MSDATWTAVVLTALLLLLVCCAGAYLLRTHESRQVFQGMSDDGTRAVVFLISLFAAFLLVVLVGGALAYYALAHALSF